MAGYVLRRIVWLVPVLVFVSLATFALMKLAPGGPWDREKPVSPQALQNLNRRYNLDRPAWEQYLSYVGNVLRGDLGPSYSYQDRGVGEILREGLPHTASLGILAALVAVAIGVPLGLAAALRRGSSLDYAALGFVSLGASVPSFVLGLLLIVVFALGLHLAPTSGWGQPRHYLLPVLSLALPPAALLAGLTRACALDVLGQDYIRTAYAKGLRERVIVWRHLLRNALIPLVTVLGPLLAFLVAGSFIVETIFSIPGVGRLYVQGIGQRDYSLIMGTTLFYAFVIAALNLVVDVLYAVIDPRVSCR